MRNGREVYMGPLAAITGKMGSKDPRVAPGSRLSGDPGRLSGLIQRTIDVSDSFHEAGEVDFVDYSGSQ
jgi:hypothetical protein